MSEFNVGWSWPRRLRRLAPDPCGSYHCLFDKPRSEEYLVGDVKRCRWHDRLIVVKSVETSTDTNGTTYYTKFKRLRPWRLAYWRARRRLAARKVTPAQATTEGSPS